MRSWEWVGVEELRSTDPPRVGPYVLLGRLGSGGMGHVFLAHSPGARLVAVKVIRPELAEDPDFRARFAREIAVARTVSGAFTAPVIAADPDAATPWLATTYVQGPSLADAVMGHGPLPSASVMTLAAGLAEALDAIHSAGVLHRDLKPANVLLADDGPRVIDFGISRAIKATVLTSKGIVIGTVGFMSPEQAEGREVGPAGDIFSLGAVLVFAATGREPFGTGSAAAVLYRVVHGRPNTSGLPGEIRAVVERCLSKDPLGRPTAVQLLGQLASLIRSARNSAGWLPVPIMQEFARNRPATDLTSDSHILHLRTAIARVDANGAMPSTETRPPLPSRSVRYLPRQVFAASFRSGTVTPIDVATNTPGRIIKVGDGPECIAITPDGKTAYVANNGSGTVTPIDVDNRIPGPAINVGDGPECIAITPDGKIAYVVCSAGTVTPIDTATNIPGTAIRIGSPDTPHGHSHCAIAITPDGETAYVANGPDGTVTPVRIATNSPGMAIKLGHGRRINWPKIAITPDGSTAYVAHRSSRTIVPIGTATNTAGRAIKLKGGFSSPEPRQGVGPRDIAHIAITPNGKIAYVVDMGSGTIIPVTIATNKPGRPIKVGDLPVHIAITPDGESAYVACAGSGKVVPISIATNVAGSPIKVFWPTFTAITSNGDVAYIVHLSSTEQGQAMVTAINTANNTPIQTIDVGLAPLNAIAIAGGMISAQ